MRRKKAISKRKGQIRHFKQRCLNRFGTSISSKSIDKIIEEIRGGRAKLIRRRSLRVATYEVEYNDQKIKVVYDKQRKTLVTALVIK